MRRLFLGIDTSNYTTSVAVTTEDGEILLNDKKLLPVEPGELGVRQNRALFEHVKALPYALDKARSHLATGQLTAVGVSTRPRAIEGSYMPCFLAGLSSAWAASVAANIPLYTFSHQCGHLMAAIDSSKSYELLDGRPFGAFHISGGTTEALSVHMTEKGFSAQIIGGTADISAGQLIDRIGVRMGLPFPCGAELEKLAYKNDRCIPRTHIHIHDGFINLSGFENRISDMIENGDESSYVAAYTLSVIKDALSVMLENVRKSVGDVPVLFSGGVMSNAYLKQQMGKICHGYFAEPVFSSDNAVGIAKLAGFRYGKGK